MTELSLQRPRLCACTSNGALRVFTSDLGLANHLNYIPGATILDKFRHTQIWAFELPGRTIDWFCTEVVKKFLDGPPPKALSVPPLTAQRAEMKIVGISTQPSTSSVPSKSPKKRLNKTLFQLRRFNSQRGKEPSK